MSGQGLKEIDPSKLKKAIEDKETFVVEFSANWCHPCKLIGPILEELADENANINFYKVDVDANNEVLDEYGIGAVPTMLFFGKGEKLSKLTGYHKKESIKEAIDKSIGSMNK